MGVPQYLSLITTISHYIHNPVRALLPHQPNGLGGQREILPWHCLSLDLCWGGGNRKYGLSTIWVNPCLGRVPSMEEAVKELTTWVSSGPNWPYTLVQLNKDTCHAPLPKEGHLGMSPAGGTDSTACRRISQLEVHELLVSGLQVAYPVRLNGHEEPIIASLPKSLANGTSLTGGGSIYLEVDILQPIAEELDWKALPLGRCSPILLASHLKTLPKNQKGKLASPWRWGISCLGQYWTCLVTCQGTQPQKCQTPWLSSHFHLMNWEISPGQWTHHPRWVPRWCWDGGSLSRGSPHHHLSHSQDSRAKQWQPSPRCKPTLREANMALGELLATKSSNTCRWKVVCELA